MKKKRYLIYAADFETTVYEGQQRTDVWSSALVKLGTDDVIVHHTIEETYNYLLSLHSNIVLYYHNLKFDGNFWLSYLLTQKGYKHSTVGGGEDIRFREDSKMLKGELKYSISKMGQWYTLTFCTGRYIIEIRDSLKLLPFTLKAVGKSFKTAHQKLDMDYEGYRYPGCEITPEEMAYIKNDVLVLKEALEFMFHEGHDKLTIGSCCLSEYKYICRTDASLPGEFSEMYPNLYEYALVKEIYGQETAGDYIRKAYRGGWCYLVKGKENRVYHNGITVDVNSLYPSMMHSESGNRYPIGYPHFWLGDYIPEEAKRHFYYIRFRCMFHVKHGKLPFVQIKGNPMYKGTECLESSDFVTKDGQHIKYYLDANGERRDTSLELTMTMTEYKLFLEHYNTENFEIISGCWFYSVIGLFDKYIDKYAKIKKESKGAKRTLAKLYLNNLYGKFAMSEDSTFKMAYEKEDGSIGYTQIKANDKTPGYIAIGAAITAYARNFTIRAAQKNYYGADKPGFIYADTDSIHCDLKAEELKGVPVHPTNFCAWKLEASWDFAKFVRQKTYTEHVTAEDLEPVEKSYYNIKCAGLPDYCKHLFLMSMREEIPEEKLLKKLSKEELEFIAEKRTLDDFKEGLRIPGKLLPKVIPGGVLLMKDYYTMR